MQAPQTHTNLTTLSPKRQQAIADGLEHVRLTAERVTVAERILTDPRMRVVTNDDDDPDDLSVAVASIEQALTCLAVAFEEIERARFMP